MAKRWDAVIAEPGMLGNSLRQQLIAVAVRRFALECAGHCENARMPYDLVQHSADGPPFDPAAAPETVVLAADRNRLRLAWPNGERAEVSAERLRAACRCAWCTRARIDGAFPAGFDRVAIDRLVPIGGYAVNIAFSDGHARGIYPWPYLRTLAQTTVESVPAGAAGVAAASSACDRP
jgi:prepilin-type processing-associated H-X9-DG protein